MRSLIIFCPVSYLIVKSSNIPLSFVAITLYSAYCLNFQLQLEGSYGPLWTSTSGKTVWENYGKKLWSFLNIPDINFNFSYLLPISLLLAEKKRVLSLIYSRTVCQPFDSTGEFWAFKKFAVEQMDSAQEAKMTEREPLVCRAQSGSVSRLSALCPLQTRLIGKKSTGLRLKENTTMCKSTKCGSRLLTSSLVLQAG